MSDHPPSETAPEARQAELPGEEPDRPAPELGLLPEPEALPPDHRSGFVAVIGRPNVGKSTLLNRLLGQKIAITSDKPQTTRDAILGIRTDPDAQYIFLDTPGIHRPRHKLGQHMVRVAEQAISQDADVVVWLVDVNVWPTSADRLIAERLQAIHQEHPLPPLLLALNQIDRWQGTPAELELRGQAYLALLEWLRPHQPTVPALALSALEGVGVDELLAAIRAHLPQGPRYYPADQVTDLTERFLVAELIREQALRFLRQEVPHSIAVVVTEWDEPRPDLVRIAATLYVERASQKKIVLGRKGQMIKQIGQAARLEIERLLGRRVYLELWVKVWEKWRRREGMLRRLGYSL